MMSSLELNFLKDVISVQSNTKNEFCFAVSEIITDSRFTSALGNIIEGIIIKDYQKKMGFNPQSDFVDVGGKSIDRVGKFVDFLQTANHLSVVERLKIIGSSWARDTAIPDILVHRDNRREFYEIKPGSKNGIRAGIEKINKFVALCLQYNLPRSRRTYLPYGGAYLSGTAYKPQTLIRPFGILKDIKKFHPKVWDIYLRVEYYRPALLIYKICISGQFINQEEAKKELFNILRKTESPKPKVNTEIKKISSELMKIENLYEEDTPTLIPAFSGKAKLFDLGERKFDFKYVTLKLKIILEVNQSIKNKNSPDVKIEFDGDGKKGQEFSIIARQKISDNIVIRGSINPGSISDSKLGIETKIFGHGELKFAAKFNWSEIFEIKLEIPYKKSITIGDWIIEGGGKLVISGVGGPNWKNIVWKQIMQRGWTVIRKFIPQMISAIWYTSAGTPTTLNVLISTVGFVGGLLALYGYFLYKGFTAEYAGKLEALGKVYANSYVSHYSHFWISNERYLLPELTINIEGKNKGSIYTYRGKEADQYILLLSKNDKLRLESLGKVLKNAAHVDTVGDERWDKLVQNARALGAAHQLSDGKKFYYLLKRMYGDYNQSTREYLENKEVIEIAETLIRVNRKNEKKKRDEVWNFMFNQFKKKVGDETKPILGFPMDLYEIIKHRFA